jgi:DNA-directed RNA polymerase subunit RPC12/RpoP
VIETFPCKFGCGSEFGTWYTRMRHESQCSFRPAFDWGWMADDTQAAIRKKRLRKKVVDKAGKERKREYDRQYYAEHRGREVSYKKQMQDARRIDCPRCRERMLLPGRYCLACRGIVTVNGELVTH